MKNAPLSILICAVAQTVSFAETTITTTNHIVYRFGDWSQPTTVSVPSADGAVALTSRTCPVIVKSSAWSESQVLEMLHYPAANEIWIGEKTPSGEGLLQYMVVGKKIWAVRTDQTMLKITHSGAMTDLAADGKVNFEGFLSKYLGEYRTGLWMDESVKRLDLRRLFGLNAFISQTSVQFNAVPARIDGVGVTAERVNVDLFATATGLHLQLAISPEFSVLEAFQGEDKLPVLCGNFNSPPDLKDWSPLNGKLVPSSEGKSKLLICSREYYRAESGRAEVNDGLPANAMAAVFPGNGNLWLGPLACRLVVVDGKIWGINVVKGELQIFTGPRMRLPLDRDTARSFLDQIRAFEEKFKANKYRIDSDFKVSVAGLLAGDARFGTDCRYHYRGVTVKDGAVKIRLGASVPYVPEVTLDVGFNVSEVRIISPDSSALEQDYK